MNGYRKEFTITEYSPTTSTKVNYKTQKERTTLGIASCVVKPSTTPMTTWPSRVLRLRGETEHDTNDNVTVEGTKTQNTFKTAHMNTDTWVRSSLCQSGSFGHDSHIAPHGSRVLRTSFHPCMMSVFLRPWVLHFLHLLHLPIHLLSLAPPPALLPLSLRAVASLCTPPKRVWTLLTRLTPSQVMSRTLTTSFTESLTSPQFSKQGFPEDVEYDDTALEEMLQNAHRVHVYHSKREGLSVGQSSSVSERTGRLVGSIGQDPNIAKNTD